MTDYGGSSGIFRNFVHSVYKDIIINLKDFCNIYLHNVSMLSIKKKKKLQNFCSILVIILYSSIGPFWVTSEEGYACHTPKEKISKTDA